MQKEEEAKDSPSFRIESPERISAADCHLDNQHDNNDDDADFDFSFIRIPEARPPIAAADIFSDGKIRPVYPLFNRDLLNFDDHVGAQKVEEKESSQPKPIRLPLRRLFIEEEREQASFSSTSSSSSSSVDELDGIPPGTYCVWTPPTKDRCKKSSSMGSSTSLRWRLRDLVVGRSQSDGKEKFVFIPIQEEEKKEIENNKGKKLLGKKPTEVDVVKAQQRMVQNGQEMGKGTVRKSFLPYKQELIGLFAGVNALGLGQNHNNPF